MKLLLTLIAVAAGSAALLGALAPPGPAGPDRDGRSFSVHPVGHVHKKDGETAIVVDPRFQPALSGLEGFSHVWVLWWFDRNDRPEKRAVLKVHPRGDSANPLTGVFATRSPARPNLIALTLCRIEAIEEARVRIESIDAFDGTPVLDLKPYIPRTDRVEDVKVPSWLTRGRSDPGKP